MSTEKQQQRQLKQNPHQDGKRRKKNPSLFIFWFSGRKEKGIKMVFQKWSVNKTIQRSWSTSLRNPLDYWINIVWMSFFTFPSNTSVHWNTEHKKLIENCREYCNVNPCLRGEKVWTLPTSPILNQHISDVGDYLLHPTSYTIFKQLQNCFITRENT